ncbi:MAG: NAD-dependent epimerase/dehydratase family protein [Steroidobacteraceae bacterium]
MRVLIFGASGYIGQRTARHLLNEGHTVTGFVRNERSRDVVQSLGAQAIVGSLDDCDATKAALASHDAAVWLAQLTLDEEKRLIGEFLKALRGSGKTFIFTGGASVLSISTKGDWSDKSFAETDSFIPRRELALRAETENSVRIAAQSGIRSIAVRPPLVYGHGGCKVISDLYHSARKTGSVCYVGKGLNAYSSVHVDDLAHLFNLALQRGVGGALYHCVAAEVPFRFMAETIARGLGVGTQSVTVEEAQQIWDKFTGSTVFSSCSRVRSPIARAELGWTAHAARSDILEECLHPAYASEAERSLASWIKPTKAAGDPAQ